MYKRQLQANPSQNRPITGVVTSATDSEPLIGVSVQVKETATGGIPDIAVSYTHLDVYKRQPVERALKTWRRQ